MASKGPIHRLTDLQFIIHMRRQEQADRSNRNDDEHAQVLASPSNGQREREKMEEKRKRCNRIGQRKAGGRKRAKGEHKKEAGGRKLE